MRPGNGLRVAEEEEEEEEEEKVLVVVEVVVLCCGHLMVLKWLRDMLSIDF